MICNYLPIIEKCGNSPAKWTSNCDAYLWQIYTPACMEHHVWYIHTWQIYTLCSTHVWRMMHDIYIHDRYTLHAACMYGAWCMIYTYMTNIHSMQHVWRIMYDRHVQQYLPNWLQDMAVTQYICVTTTLSNNRQRLRMYVQCVHQTHIALKVLLWMNKIYLVLFEDTIWKVAS